MMRDAPRTCRNCGDARWARERCQACFAYVLRHGRERPARLYTARRVCWSCQGPIDRGTRKTAADYTICRPCFEQRYWELPPERASVVRHRRRGVAV